MKLKTFFLAASALLYSAVGIAQTESTCKTYIPVSKGTVLEYDEFDKKGKLTGSQIMEIKDVRNEGGVMTIDVHSVNKDKKGEQTFENDFSYTCEGDVFKVSMETHMSGEQMEAYKDMDIEMDAGDLEIPSNLSVGQKLNDGTLTVKISSNGFQISSIKVDVFDRIVETQESISTDAGSFDCFKMKSSSKTKIGFINAEGSSIEWIAPNVGVVKSETYDKKGNLSGSRVLKSLTPGS